MIKETLCCSYQLMVFLFLAGRHTSSITVSYRITRENISIFQIVVMSSANLVSSLSLIYYSKYTYEQLWRNYITLPNFIFGLYFIYSYVVHIFPIMYLFLTLAFVSDINIAHISTSELNLNAFLMR